MKPKITQDPEPMPQIRPDLKNVRTEELFAEITRRLSRGAGEPEPESTERVATMEPESWGPEHEEDWRDMSGVVDVLCQYAAEAHRHAGNGFGAGMIEQAINKVLLYSQRTMLYIPRLQKLELAARKAESKRMLERFRELEREYRRGGRSHAKGASK